MAFVDELEDETETRQSQGSESGRPGGLGEDQADSKGKKVIEAIISDQVNIPSRPISSGGFDDNITIGFSSSILRTLDASNLFFLDQDKTPQSKPSQQVSTSQAVTQGQLPYLKKN